MIDNNFIDCIIELPVDLFFGTNIATCILVLKKNKSDNNILFIDASDEFVRTSNKNKLSSNNIDNIISIIKDRKDINGKAYLASYEEVKNNEFNISVNSYLKTNTEDNNIDIEEVNKKLSEVVPRQQQIREELEEIIKELEDDCYE